MSAWRCRVQAAAEQRRSSSHTHPARAPWSTAWPPPAQAVQRCRGRRLVSAGCCTAGHAGSRRRPHRPPQARSHKLPPAPANLPGPRARGSQAPAPPPLPPCTAPAQWLAWCPVWRTTAAARRRTPLPAGRPAPAATPRPVPDPSSARPGREAGGGGRLLRRARCGLPALRPARPAGAGWAARAPQRSGTG